MVTTKSNLDLCSRLGTTRVCNIRKTKFREAHQYIVPLDIGHDRILVITNSTSTNYTMTSLCNNEPLVISTVNHAVLRTPANCAIVAKTFEISKLQTDNDIETLGMFVKIESASLYKSSSKSTQLKTIKTITKSNSDFGINNNITESKLKEVKYNQNWTSETWFLGTAGSMSSIGAIALVVMVTCGCLRYGSCRGS